jgi:transcriptional regulator with XRE-family HTH domain
MAPVHPLKIALKAAGRTQRELCRTIGLAEESLSRAIHGRRILGRATQERIAREVGFPIKILFPPDQGRAA